MHRTIHLLLHRDGADHPDLPAAIDAVQALGHRVERVVTDSAEDARTAVRRAVEARADTIVAGGGDGSFSEIATALARMQPDAGALPALGLIPMGTANDFAGAAGIPDDVVRALEMIVHCEPRPIDLLRLLADGDEHWAVNLVSGGFGPQVTLLTDKGLKQVFGGFAYLLTGLAKLGKIKPVSARISGEDLDWEGDFIALGVGNGRQAGGGRMLCPDALVDDGLLDVTIIPELEGEIATTVKTLISDGRFAALDQVATRRRMASVDIVSADAIILNLDGEPVEARTWRIECVPGRLYMHLPDDCPLLAGD